MKKEKKVMSLYISEHIRDRVKKWGADRGLSLSAAINFLLAKALEEEEEKNKRRI